MSETTYWIILSVVKPSAVETLLSLET